MKTYHILSCGLFFTGRMLLTAAANPYSSASSYSSSVMTMRRNNKMILTSLLLDTHGGGGVDAGVVGTKEAKKKASSSTVGEIFSLSANERLVNILQLPILLTLAGLIRMETISRFIVNLLSIFPSAVMPTFEKLSIINWIIHYVTLAYNVGIFQRLFYDDGSSSPGTTTRKKRIMAIFFTGFGQIFGSAFILSHSVIGMPPSSATSAVGQSIYNLGRLLLLFSAMTVGPLLLLSNILFVGIPVSFLIGYGILNGLVSFSTLPGILLSNLGLIAVLTSSRKDFSPMFKLGFVLYSFLPVIMALVGKFIVFDEESDLFHTTVQSCLAIITIFQRWALIRDDRNKVKEK